MELPVVEKKKKKSRVRNRKNRKTTPPMLETQEALFISPEIRKTIIDSMKEGNYISTSCMAAGIARSTFMRWEKLAAEGKEPYATFWLEVEEAEALAETQTLRQVKKLADAATNWTGPMTVLERRFHERWGRRDRVQVDGNVATTIEVTLATPNVIGALPPSGQKTFGSSLEVMDAELVERGK